MAVTGPISSAPVSSTDGAALAELGSFIQEENTFCADIAMT